MSSVTTVILICFVMTATANILMPHSIFSTRAEGMVEQPPNYQDEIMDDKSNGELPILEDEPNELPKTVIQQQHNRNCFFTPVQCMLPLSDSHKDIQSLHGVYSPTASHVRRSVESIPMLTSPWGYTDLIKRGGDNRFYQWLSRF